MAFADGRHRPGGLFSRLVACAPYLTMAILAGPVVAGLAGAVLPAFGYLPSLGGRGLSLVPFAELFGQPGIWISTGLSLFVGLAATAISLGIVLLLIAAWSETRALRLIRALIAPLLSVPHAAAAFGLAFLIAPSGWIARLLSPWATGFDRPPDWLIINDPYGLALVAGLVAKEIPFLFLVSLAALTQIRADERSILARTLGYGRMAGWLKTVLPALYPRIRLPVCAVIAYGASAVDTALILGPTRPPILAVRILDWQADPDLAMRFVASAGAVLQALVVIAAIAGWLAAERLLRSAGRGLLSDGRRWHRDRSGRVMTAVVGIASALAVFLGLAILAIWSVAHRWRYPDALPAKYSLRTWSRATETLAEPIWTTLVIAGLATALSLALTVLCLEREHRHGRTAGSAALALIYLPLLVPQVSFLFGMNILFANVRLDGTLAGVVIAHTVFVLPYVFLSLADPWRKLDPRYSVTAAALGSTANRSFWRIRAAMLVPPILTAAAVGLAVSVSQYLPTLMIGAGRVQTVTTETLALVSGGNRRLIGAYALVQTLLAFLGFAVAALLPLWLYRDRRGMGTGP